MPTEIHIEDYNAAWPEMYAQEADRIRRALGTGVLKLEHIGSTSVQGLDAKPVIDVLLAVTDSANEDAYVPPLIEAGYVLSIREPEWHQHRMFNRPGAQVNLHVYSDGCAEIERTLRFRDWLRAHEEDRALYAQTKRSLAKREWDSVQDYADAKGAVVELILKRALQL